jgi:hypothetical protein
MYLNFTNPSEHRQAVPCPGKVAAWQPSATGARVS